MINHVESSLSDLKEFIAVADVGLSNIVEEGDYSGLVECMGHLMAVRDRTDTTDVMFEPLKQTIELLKVTPYTFHDNLFVKTYCIKFTKSRLHHKETQRI